MPQTTTNDANSSIPCPSFEAYAERQDTLLGAFCSSWQTSFSFASFTIADIPASGITCRSRRQLTPTRPSHSRASKLAHEVVGKVELLYRLNLRKSSNKVWDDTSTKYQPYHIVEERHGYKRGVGGPNYPSSCRRGRPLHRLHLPRPSGSGSNDCSTIRRNVLLVTPVSLTIASSLSGTQSGAGCPVGEEANGQLSMSA